MNFTPQVYRNYRIGVPFLGYWREVLNTDSARYGGTNVGNNGGVQAFEQCLPPRSVSSIPPLAALFFVPEP